jgi:GR25 family glycosyltransferase involved in LPS biosynthesis
MLWLYLFIGSLLILAPITIWIIFFKNNTFKILQKYESYIEKYSNKFKDFKYPVYYINLDKSIERRNQTEKELSKITNNITRIPAIDGSKIKNKFGDTVDSISFKSDYDIDNLKSIACTLSHIKAIHQAYNNGDNIAMICEDDIYTEPYKTSFSIEEIVNNAPKNWEILQLHTGNIDIFKNLSMNELNYKKFEDKNWSFASYLINRNGMKKILQIVGYPYHIKYIDLNFPEHLVADVYIPNIVNTYTVLPFPFTVKIKGESTVQHGHVLDIHLPSLLKYYEYLLKNLKVI